MPSSLTLPEWGMTRGGELFELPTLAPHTGAHGCSSLLPTPCSQEPGGTAENGNLALTHTVALLGTPSVADAMGHIGDTLPDAVWKIEGRTQESRGASTPPPSPAGNTPSDDPHHGQLTIEDA